MIGSHGYSAARTSEARYLPQGFQAQPPPGPYWGARPPMPVQYPGMIPKHLVRHGIENPWSRPDQATPLFSNRVPDGGRAFLMPGKRSRMNIVGICANLLGPWFLFCLVFGCQSLDFHYQHPYLVWLVSLFGILCSLFLFCLAASKRSVDHQPHWYNFAAITCGFGTICATVFGNANFWIHTFPYFNILNLGNIGSVNPARVSGQQMMDVGVVNWADGSGLDTQMSMSFKSDTNYCVAPIVNDGEHMRYYDFWAVGINCCNEVDGSLFQCGEWNSPHARAGLRLIHMDQTPFYRLAVQQAEAAFHIKAPHPVFFTWMADPAEEIASWHDAVLKHYIEGVLVFFVFNAVSVAIAMIGFSRIGYLDKSGFKG